MDLLKGITQGLQGQGEPDSGDERDRSDHDAAADAGRDAATDGGPERDRDDEHVCDFCGTAFAASRGTCPDCGAEIIVRGRR